MGRKTKTADYSDRVTLCPDGKYRWIYEFSMMKNPVILLVVYKIFFWLFVGLWILISLLDRSKEHSFFDSLLLSGQWILIFWAVFCVIIALGYTIVAGQYGWKYIVFFEMDEDSIIHRQIKEQVKKAQALGWLTAFAGAMGGNLGAISAGIHTATKTTSVSDFNLVRSIKPKRRWNTIKVNEPFCKNQVYVHRDDFDFVLNYIRTRCPKVKKH